MITRKEAPKGEGLQQTHFAMVEDALKQYTKKLFVAGPLSYYNPDVVYYSGESLTTIEKDIYRRPIGLHETFYVAPRNDACNPKHADGLMKDIAKTLSSSVQLQRVEPDRSFHRTRYGSITCHDTLASEVRKTAFSVTEIEPGALAKLGLQPGETERSESHDIRRRITITFVPHPVLAVILRNEVPKYLYSDTQQAEELTRDISELQLQKLIELLRNKYPHPQHILYELVTVAKREEYRDLEEQIDRFKKAHGVF